MYFGNQFHLEVVFQFRDVLVLTPRLILWEPGKKKKKKKRMRKEKEKERNEKKKEGKKKKRKKKEMKTSRSSIWTWRFLILSSNVKFLSVKSSAILAAESPSSTASLRFSICSFISWFFLLLIIILFSKKKKWKLNSNKKPQS